MAQGMPIKNCPYVEVLLEAIHLPKQLAVLNCAATNLLMMILLKEMPWQTLLSRLQPFPLLQTLLCTYFYLELVPLPLPWMIWPIIRPLLPPPMKSTLG